MWSKVTLATLLPLLTAAVQVWFQSALFRHQFEIFSYGNFTQDANRQLVVTKVKSFVSDGPVNCAFACIGEPQCLSFNLAAHPDSYGLYQCELLATDKFKAAAKAFQASDAFHHYSPWSLCQQAPCQNKGICYPDFQMNTYQCVFPVPCKFDFENGIDDWEKTGTVFDNQPTFGDNPTARNRGQSANQQGDWWIGGAEDRPSKSTPAGRLQDDGPQGTLTSHYFKIIGNNISFLIGGGCYINSTRAELVIDKKVVKTATGACHETMTRQTWDVQNYTGQIARVKLVDSSSGSWGHINFDDLKGDMRCM
ncbi:putative glycosyl hydrolase ecdE [Acropora cervicornis]|uniref:Glycosyl hydrolase ecdE n=1 Tax=Acropora cervicornis TaxID=6130 RepID=A0AAD9VBU4_ACRCE|nr:putative glycosyl hydrolase ecdE [Acropora cervicornis]